MPQRSGASLITSPVSGLLRHLLGLVFLLLPDGNHDRGNDAKSGEAAGDKPVGHHIAEAVDQRRCHRSQRESNADHKRDRHCGAGHVFEREPANGRFGLIDEAGEQGL